MLGKLLLLLIPAILTAIGLIVLKQIRPSTSGSLDIEGSQDLSVQVADSVNIESLENLTDIIVQGVPITIRAQTIVIDGDRKRTFTSVRLSPADLSIPQLTYDAPQSAKPAMSFKIRSRGAGTLRVSHRRSAGSRGAGFYLFLSALEASRLVHSFTFAAPCTIALTIKGAHFTANSGSGSVDLLQRPGEVARLQLVTKDANYPTDIDFETGPDDTSDYLRVGYAQPRESVPPQVLSGAALNHEFQSRINGRVKLFVNGRAAPELESALEMKVQGAQMRINDDGLFATDKGLNFRVNGRFSSVSVVDHGQSEELLPTVFDQISVFVALLIGVVVYVIDKIITVFNFVYVEKKQQSSTQ
jgi:hypothetical protein